jgi:hypothetical protein
MIVAKVTWWSRVGAWCSSHNDHWTTDTVEWSIPRSTALLGERATRATGLDGWGTHSIRELGPGSAVGETSRSSAHIMLKESII